MQYRNSSDKRAPNHLRRGYKQRILYGKTLLKAINAKRALTKDYVSSGLEPTCATPPHDPGLYHSAKRNSTRHSLCTTELSFKPKSLAS